MDTPDRDERHGQESHPVTHPLHSVAQSNGGRELTSNTPRQRDEDCGYHNGEAVAYRYAPLYTPTACHLLEILPRNVNDLVIRSSLHIVDLDKQLPIFCSGYTALSYAWGSLLPDSAHLTHHIVCDGASLSVTENLYLALLRIRQMQNTQWHDTDRDTRPYFWIDAICIDQCNPREKAQQVRLMARIYSRALRLVVWLGELPEDEPIRDDIKSAIRDLAQRHTVYSDQQEIELSRHRLEVIFQLPWFGRRWVLQEVLLTDRQQRYMLLGQSSWQMTSFVDKFPPIIQACYEEQTEVEEYRRNQRLLSRRLCGFHKTRCSVPHDRYYALFSICADVDDIKIDYEQSYTALAITMAVRLRSDMGTTAVMIWALILRAGYPRDAHASALPSWVPDWHIEPRPSDAEALCRAQPGSLLLKDGGWEVARRFTYMYPALSKHYGHVGDPEDLVLRLRVWLLDPTCSLTHREGAECLSCHFRHTQYTPDPTDPWSLGRQTDFNSMLDVAKECHCVLAVEPCFCVAWVLEPSVLHPTTGSTGLHASVNKSFRLVDYMNIDDEHMDLLKMQPWLQKDRLQDICIV